MYVCVCKALTERDLRQAVAEGCHSVKDLKRHIGFASECGICASCAKDFLRPGASAAEKPPVARLRLVRQAA